MATVALYIGHNVDGKPVHNHAEVVATVSALSLACEIDGFTAYEASGMYKGECESTTVCVFSMLTEEQVELLRFNICYALRLRLAQECIGWEQRTDDMEYI